MTCKDAEGGTRSLQPLGSPASGASTLRLCTCRGRAAEAALVHSRGAVPFFSTLQTPVGLCVRNGLFFTVFKDGSNCQCTSQERPTRTPAFFIWCSAQWDAAACLCGGGGELWDPLLSSCRTGLGDSWSLL